MHESHAVDPEALLTVAPTERMFETDVDTAFGFGFGIDSSPVAPANAQVLRHVTTLARSMDEVSVEQGIALRVLQVLTDDNTSNVASEFAATPEFMATLMQFMAQASHRAMGEHKPRHRTPSVGLATTPCTPPGQLEDDGDVAIGGGAGGGEQLSQMPQAPSADTSMLSMEWCARAANILANVCRHSTPACLAVWGEGLLALAHELLQRLVDHAATHHTDEEELQNKLAATAVAATDATVRTVSMQPTADGPMAFSLTSSALTAAENERLVRGQWRTNAMEDVCHVAWHCLYGAGVRWAVAEKLVTEGILVRVLSMCANSAAACTSACRLLLLLCSVSHSDALADDQRSRRLAETASHIVVAACRTLRAHLDPNSDNDVSLWVAACALLRHLLYWAAKDSAIGITLWSTLAQKNVLAPLVDIALRLQAKHAVVVPVLPLTLLRILCVFVCVPFDVWSSAAPQGVQEYLQRLYASPSGRAAVLYLVSLCGLDDVYPPQDREDVRLCSRKIVQALQQVSSPCVRRHCHV